MKKRIAFRQLGRTSKHKWAMLRNMVTSLIKHERIVTTVAKAKELRKLADNVVGYAKKGKGTVCRKSEKRCCGRFCSSRNVLLCFSVADICNFSHRPGNLRSRRKANAIIQEKPMVTKLFEVLGPRYEDRDGGYTRVMKIARFRVGDNAPLALIEYVDRPGEIRAARPPKARRERLLAGGALKDALEGVGIKSIEGSDDITPDEADVLTQDAGK